jgi:predicted DNA-binding protein
MALRKKRATTIALPPEMDELLTRAAEAQGVSRSEVVRQRLVVYLEQFKEHARPRSAGVVRRLRERGDESELFSARR